MAREQVTTVPRRQARGGHIACAPAAGRVSDPSTEVQTPARDKQRRVQPRCPRPDQLSPASSAHRGGRAAPSPLLRASARLRRRARNGAGLANALQAWRARARTTRHARTCPPCPCAHNAARPHLQRCDRGVDGPGAGDDGPPAAGEGSQAWARSRSCPKGPCAATAVATVGPEVRATAVATVGRRQRSFSTLLAHCVHVSKYFVLPKDLKPYKTLQKCQKLLANFSSENKV
jgi:hypothetical protein